MTRASANGTNSSAATSTLSSVSGRGRRQGLTSLALDVTGDQCESSCSVVNHDVPTAKRAEVFAKMEPDRTPAAARDSFTENLRGAFSPDKRKANNA